MYCCHVGPSVLYPYYRMENRLQTSQTHVTLSCRCRWAITSLSSDIQWLLVPVTMIRYLRPSAHLWAANTAPVAVRSACARSSELGRSYATHSDLGRGPSTSAKSRKNITVLSDDGRLQWEDLSGREKMSRATQQSFNFMVVLAGAVLTV